MKAPLSRAIRRPAAGRLLCLLALLSQPAFGDLPDDVQFHGFASQGLLYSTGNDFFGDSTQGSFDFTELALNGSWRPLNQLQFSAQALFRRAGETDDQKLRLDYGFVDYTLASGMDARWGLRLGRIANSVGFYNDTRDVPFTRPGILLPQSLYFDSSRLFAADGISFYGELRTQSGELSLLANVVQVLADAEGFEAAVFGGRISGDFDSRTTYITRLLYDWDGGRARVGLSYAQLNLDFIPESPPGLQAGSLQTTFYALSLQYNSERHSLTSELVIRPEKFRGFGPPLPDDDITGFAWYLQGSYRFAANWEALLRFDLAYRDLDDTSGKAFAAATGLPAHLRFAKDWTLGFNWDINSSLSLRAEYHRVDGNAWLSALENPDPAAIDRQWGLFALQLSARF